MKKKVRTRKTCKTCAAYYPCAKNITNGTRGGCPQWQSRKYYEKNAKIVVAI